MLVLALAASNAFALDLTSTAPVIGEPMALTVFDGAAGSTVEVYASLRGPGAGPCPPTVAPTCGDLSAPVLLDTVVLDAEGRATVTTPPLPTAWTAGRRVGFQALSAAEASAPLVRRVGTALSGPVTVLDPTDLTILTDVARVDGDLTLDLPPGTPLRLPTLAEVDTLIVSGVGALALPSLTHAGTVIVDDTRLTDLSGLGALTTLRDGLAVSRNPDLVSADLPPVRLDTEGIFVSVFENAALRGVREGGHLTDLGLLIVLDNPELRRIGGFDRLRSVAGNANLSGQPLMTRMSFPALEEVGAGLYFDGDHSLTDLTAFSALRTVGTLDLWQCSGLTDLAGLEALERATELTIREVDNLISLDGLDGLTDVTGDLTVEFMPSLEDIDALQGVRTVGGAFTLRDAPRICQSDVDALEAATGLSVQAVDIDPGC